MWANSFNLYVNDIVNVSNKYVLYAGDINILFSCNITKYY